MFSVLYEVVQSWMQHLKAQHPQVYSAVERERNEEEKKKALKPKQSKIELSLLGSSPYPSKYMK